MSEPGDRDVHRRLKRQADKLENLASEAQTRSSFSLNNAEEQELRDLVQFLQSSLDELRLANVQARLQDVEQILFSLKDDLAQRRKEGRPTRVIEAMIWEAENERGRVLASLSHVANTPSRYLAFHQSGELPPPPAVPDFRPFFQNLELGYSPGADRALRQGYEWELVEGGGFAEPDVFTTRRPPKRRPQADRPAWELPPDLQPDPPDYHFVSDEREITRSVYDQVRRDLSSASRQLGLRHSYLDPYPQEPLAYDYDSIEQSLHESFEDLHRGQQLEEAWLADSEESWEEESVAIDAQMRTLQSQLSELSPDGGLVPEVDDLEEIDLEEPDDDEADLHKFELEDYELDDADLEDIEVEPDEVDLDEVEFEDDELDEAELDEVEFEDDELDEAELDEVKFEDDELDEAELDEVEFEDDELDEAELDEVEFEDDELDEAELDEVEFEDDELDEAALDEVEFEDDELDEAELDEVEFEDDELSEAELDEVEFEDDELSEAELDEVEFEDDELSEADLEEELDQVDLEDEGFAELGLNDDELDLEEPTIDERSQEAELPELELDLDSLEIDELEEIDSSELEGIDLEEVDSIDDELELDDADLEDVEVELDEADLEDVEVELDEADLEDVEVELDEADLEDVKVELDDVDLEEDVEVELDEADLEDVEVELDDADLEEDLEVELDEADLEDVEIELDEADLEDVEVELDDVDLEEDVEVELDDADLEADVEVELDDADLEADVEVELDDADLEADVEVELDDSDLDVEEDSLDLEDEELELDDDLELKDLELSEDEADLELEELDLDDLEPSDEEIDLDELDLAEDVELEADLAEDEDEDAAPEVDLADEPESPAQTGDTLLEGAPGDLAEGEELGSPVELLGADDLGSELLGAPQLDGSPDDLFSGPAPADTVGDDFFTGAAPEPVADQTIEDEEEDDGFIADLEPPVDDAEEEERLEPPSKEYRSSILEALRQVQQKGDPATTRADVLSVLEAAVPKEYRAAVSERRRLVRLSCEYDVNCFQGNQIFHATIRDISLGGMKIEVTRQLEAGSELQVSNPNRTEDEPDERITAQVRWYRVKDSGKAEVGLQFVDPPEVLGRSWVVSLLNRVGMQSQVFNQRKYTRAAADFDIDIVDASGDIYPGRCVDLGLGGALVDTVPVFEVEDMLTFRCLSFGVHGLLECQSKVVKVKHLEETFGRYALEFENLDAATTKLLGRYVVDLLKLGRGSRSSS